MKWFKHDSDAHTDAKLRKLRIRYGAEGYGIYWYCLELISGNIERDNLTFELEHDAEIIAHDFGIHMDSVQEMMKFMCDLGLFEVTGSGVITCLKMARRLDQSMTSKPAFRKALKDISGQGHDRVMTGSCKKRREENRIEQEKEKKKTVAFAPPTHRNLTCFVKDNNLNLDPPAFIDFYQSKNWMVGKTKMKDWQAAARNWSRRQNKENPHKSSVVDKRKWNAMGEQITDESGRVL